MKKLSLVLSAVFAIVLMFSACKESKKGTSSGFTTGVQQEESVSPEDMEKINAFAERYMRIEKSREHVEREIRVGNREKSDIEKIEEETIAFDDEIAKFLTTEGRKQAYKKAVQKLKDAQ